MTPDYKSAWEEFDKALSDGIASGKKALTPPTVRISLLGVSLLLHDIARKHGIPTDIEKETP